MADAVQVTLGPKGRQVIIEQPFGGPKITKDGVSVARALEFEDRYQNVGANLVKQVASSTNDVAGDGTTTATVLTRAILAEGLKSVAAGMNPMDLRRGIQRGVERVVADLQGRATKISSTEEIAQVATISAKSAPAPLNFSISLCICCCISNCFFSISYCCFCMSSSAFFWAYSMESCIACCSNAAFCCAACCCKAISCS